MHLVQKIPIMFSCVHMFLAVVLAYVASSASGAYTLNKTYDATNFFSSFDFQDSTDIWSYGNTSYLSVSEAQKKGLVKNDSDRIFLGADAVTTGGEWRDSVRLESK